MLLKTVFQIIEYCIKYLIYLCSPKYSKFGECKKCGKCCDNILLVIDNKEIDTEEKLEKLKEKEPVFKRFEIKKFQDGDLYLRCSYLTKDRLCKDYKNRPSFCRKYPESEMIELGGHTLDDCGFIFLLKKPPIKTWKKTGKPFHDILKHQIQKKLFY